MQKSFSLSDAIRMGLAPDGGLFIPEVIPKINASDISSKNLTELAIQLLTPFFKDDQLKPHLKKICQNTFNFQIPLQNLTSAQSILELYHGETGAFKDVGARFVAQCMQYIGDISIIVATSGDTGGAVAAAFRDTRNKVIILYPRNRVTPFQEQQLVQMGENIHGLSIDGSFDDCQYLAKRILQEFRNVSSANSINIARLLPQMVYYAYSSLNWLEDHDQPADYIIPTGNFGNALACLWAKLSGFPIGKIYLATNANSTLEEYFNSGEYLPRESKTTLASAMDVGDPSNFERYKVIAPLVEHEISVLSVSNEQILNTIEIIKKDYGRIVCPHTATAMYIILSKSLSNCIAVATAHPFKFIKVIEQAIEDVVELPLTMIAPNFKVQRVNCPNDIIEVSKVLHSLGVS
ncbi:MAG: threonine synthase [Candidatus Heimdallarchaeota archaeon]|nr:threonine synthase [Candidatus Heimdallarchaeota archaeon]